MCWVQEHVEENGHSTISTKDVDDWLPITGDRHAKWWYAAFHNVTAMVGAGVLSLPYAMVYLTWLVTKKSISFQSYTIKNGGKFLWIILIFNLEIDFSKCRPQLHKSMGLLIGSWTLLIMMIKSRIQCLSLSLEEWNWTMHKKKTPMTYNLQWK